MQVSGTIDTVCPGPDACGDGGYIAPQAFDYLQSGGGPCSGDSGGPAFVVRNSTEYVAGVTSYGDQDCTLYGVSTTVSEYASWIETFLAGGGNEDCTNGVDDDSDGAADCDDSDCALHAACLPPNACNAPLPISCGDTVSGTTAGAYSVFGQNGCATSTWSGPEVVYELNAGQGASVTAQLAMGGSGDLDLFVFAENGGSCDLASCIDASLEPGSAPETVRFSMPAAARYLMVDTWDTASAYTLSVSCSGAPVESCTNGRDDDGDGGVDCADADCVTTPFCRDDIELCNNAVDDDGDGLVDCDDSDCAEYPDCPAEICDNRIDDDADGAIDCADPSCAVACGGVSGSRSSDQERGCNSAGRGSGPWQAALALALLVVLTRSRRRGRG
jgi:hypothetical protein